MRKKDYLIVGQGLAGSFLAWRLIQEGKTVMIVDDDHRNCSSFTAAGMVNPITGKRLVLSQRCEELLPYAKKFYQELEVQFKEKFFEAKEIIRLFRNEQEMDEWERKRSQTSLEKYYGEKRPPGNYGPALNDTRGSFLIQQGGYCRKLALMKCFTEYFLKMDVLVKERFHWDDLIVNEAVVEWKGERFSKVVFCEGYQAKDNPWFSWLPFNLAKGEILTLSAPEGVIPDAVMSFGKWCIPLSEGRYAVGSTYSWDRSDCELTVQGKEEILKTLGEFVKVDFHLEEHKAGVRPILIDLKPVMGWHPKTPRVGIFNGLASKGLIWGPFYSRQMADFLIRETPLEKEVNLSRFYKKYFPGEIN